MIRIGSRGSKLAIIQAKIVQAKIVNILSVAKSEVPIITIKTMGDKIQNKPLYEIGGKGLFLKELEEALLTNQIDIAVHSLKDVPAVIPEKLRISAVVDKANSFDAFLSPLADNFLDLPKGASVGTSSPRRAAQIINLRSDIKIIPLRGNIQTRIKKLEEKVVDATILAVAGLDRIDFPRSKYHIMNCNEMIPAVGQGVICIETREEDKLINQIASKINNKSLYQIALCERIFLEGMNANCRTPLGGYAELISDKELKFTGMVAKFDGSQVIRVVSHGKKNEYKKIALNALDKIRQNIDEDFFSNE